VNRTYASYKNKTYEEQRGSRIRSYGISTEEYDQMLLDQNGVCYICNKKPSDKRALDIDHNHETGEVRGLLCSQHNRAIGLFDDSINLLAKAIEYLSRNK
jgi:hypothetical protein